MRKSIEAHEGAKYLRTIRDATNDSHTAQVDVYAVLVAFNVLCPGRQQAIKKLLCAGLRGKGSQLDDLIGADAALSRAIELQKRREAGLIPIGNPNTSSTTAEIIEREG